MSAVVLLPADTDVIIIIILYVLDVAVLLVISNFSSGTSRRPKGLYTALICITPLFLYAPETCSGCHLSRRTFDILEFGRVSSRTILTVSTSVETIRLLITGSTSATTNNRII
jgi:hypothetical protein